jgi:hypothetical protein
MTTLLLIGTKSFGQTTDINEAKIIGKWIYTKTTNTKDGKTVDKTNVKWTDVFEFTKDGNYIETSSEDNPKIKGKWKVLTKENKIHLFNSIFVPNNPKWKEGDHDLNFIKVNGEYYITYQDWDVEFAPETIYYKKQK